MKVFVTGVAGQLGFDVANELTNQGITVIGSDILSQDKILDDCKISKYIELDITDELSVAEIIQNVKPDAIIHCAAWTDVDGAENESNRGLVEKINVVGTRNLALASKKIDAKFLYISTDYVFGGQGTKAWQPDDKAFSPQNFYGKAKLLGEKEVCSILEKYFIVRIAWVFGLKGKNFVKTIIRLAEKNLKEIKVVDDQIGTPTYTIDLAKLLVEMIKTENYGFYHATNEGGFISWADFAEEILKDINSDVVVKKVTTEEYGVSVAKRPLNSRLDKTKLLKNGFELLPDWKDALKRFIASYMQK